MRIVLLGAPGSGKGTQAQRLQAKYRVPQISSGDLLRDAVARGTDLGLKAKAAMDAGTLVSDDIVLGLIRERLGSRDTKAGFVLDGFPRNSDQANALNAMLVELGAPLDAVLFMDVHRETLFKRLAGRRICRTCGRVFNISFSPPGTPPRCDTCADHPDLYQRPDDKDEVIANRLEVYAAQTQPLIDHYRKLGLLRVVQGEGDLGEVFARMETAAREKPPAARSRKADTRRKPGKKVLKKKAGKKAAKRAVAAQRSVRKATRPVAKAAARKVPARRAPARKANARKTAKKAGAKKQPASKKARKK